MTKKYRVTMDFETRSTCELKKTGAYKYSLHPSTRATCFAFKVHGDKNVELLPFHLINKPFSQLPIEIQNRWNAFIRSGFIFSAHNAFFETCIYKNILVARLGWPDIPFNRFRCTAAKAASCALPRALEGACIALRLVVQKDRRGYAAMMATCKPTKQYNAWVKAGLDVKSGKRVGKKKLELAAQDAPPMFLEPDNDPQGVYPVLYHYCKTDVRAEEGLDDALPDLIPIEQEIWFLNQQLNWRGLRVDIPTIKKAVKILNSETIEKTKELDDLTMGLVDKPGAVKSILQFLEAEGVELPNLRAKTVDDVLQTGELTENQKRILEIRKALSRTSTKKYQSFLDRANRDERVRDILMYHGAATGRDTGTGVQPHNFPRGLLKVDYSRPYEAVEDVIKYDSDSLKLFYGENLSILFSSILRNMLLPSQGHELFVADFAKIEVAVCWWLADNRPGLKILTDGRDPYKTLATMNTGKTYEEIEDDGDDRQLAKHQILLCQFGGGWKKFQETAWELNRLKLSDKQSKFAVNQYRQLFPNVPALWKSYERAAISVVKNGPGSLTTAGKCRFFYTKGFLWIELPSGRRLAYRDPQIVMRDTEFGPRETLEFWGAKGKHWRLERTWGGSLTENIVQATARDLMMQGILRLEKNNYRALLTVHDEAICERKTGQGNVDEFKNILCEPPTWAKGCPIAAKGWRGPRYRK